MSRDMDSQLRQAHEPFVRDHNRLREELMASLPSEPPWANHERPVVRGWRWLGDSRMRRRIVATSAIAATLVFIVVGFQPAENGNGRVYAFADIPEILNATETIHFKGRGRVTVKPEPPEDQKWFTKETWLDLRTGRSRRLSASFGVSTSSVGSEWWIDPYEIVCDGTYRMLVDHGNKIVQFTVMSPYERMLNKRRDSVGLFEMLFGPPYEFAGFDKVGQESINGQAYDVWEGAAVAAAKSNDADAGIRVKCWLSPETGEIGRIHSWGRTDDNAEKAVPEQQYDLIERNVHLPADVFETKVPEGYSVTTDKEHAVVRELDDEAGVRVDNLEFDIRISFTLDDGSVIVAWRSTDDEEPVDEQELVAELEMGGPLPKFPIELVRLTPRGLNTDTVYEGRHLAWTEKTGKLIEWALYVPLTTPPARSDFSSYQGIHRVNPMGRLKNGSMTLVVSADIVVNREEFDAFVIGAMVELSDDGRAPEHVTYDRVTELSKEIRTTINRSGPTIDS